MEGETMARVFARRVLLGAASLIAAVTPLSLSAQSFRDRLPQDEVMDFMLPDRFENGDPDNDRGGLSGDRLTTGYDPTRKGFYHGGDLKGRTARLDYIKALGATAIWLGPIFKNKPVQGGPGQKSAGYHGYWITDFTTVDPHLGTEADMRAFVDVAHARGMKVYMDIITNHTADVIADKECPNSSCVYRSRADYPYQRQAAGGAAINPGFKGDGDQTPENFANLTNPNFAYTPFGPKAETDVKVPAWLNDPLLYHNRGNTIFRGESSTMGDFVGLDDLMTENPRVVQGLIDTYGDWIDKYGVDGFRIDTARHVNPEFWQSFVPAMLARAKAKGIPNFHIVGEVTTSDIDVALLAKHTRVDKLPAVLDFAYARAVADTVAGAAGADIFTRLFDNDALYEGGVATARHPIYQMLAKLSALPLSTPALTRGRQIIGNYEEKPGLFAVSRIDPSAKREVLIVFNTSTAAITRNVEVFTDSVNFRSLHGRCAAKATAPGSYSVTIAALDFVVRAAGEAE
jgi:Alpha amylase, catalytic domain